MIDAEIYLKLGLPISTNPSFGFVLKSYALYIAKIPKTSESKNKMKSI
jgi:hypothetical protein